jgi:hypothetical protein
MAAPGSRRTVVLVDPILRQTKEPPLRHEFNRSWGIPRWLLDDSTTRSLKGRIGP